MRATGEGQLKGTGEGGWGGEENNLDEVWRHRKERQGEETECAVGRRLAAMSALSASTSFKSSRP